MLKLLKLVWSDGERESTSTHTSVAWSLLLFAHTAHASFRLKLNCKYKTKKIIVAFTINNIYFKSQAHITLSKSRVKLAACGNNVNCIIYIYRFGI